MNKRLRDVRKVLKLNQTEFATQIGIAQSGYSLIETGENALTEQNIKLICLIFNVNETWLRTGKGEMFDTISKPKNEEEKNLVEMFRRLSPEMRAFVLRKIRELLRLDGEFAP
jgi:transcriptional regulator with XRE-family HTH domain